MFWLVLSCDLKRQMHRSWQGSIQVWFLWTNHNVLISKVTNEFASLCRDNTLHQMAIFCEFVQMRKGSTQLVCNYLFLLYKTNWFHVAMRLFSKRSQKTWKCGKNMSGKRSESWVCHSDIICDLLLNRCTATMESISLRYI